MPLHSQKWLITSVLAVYTDLTLPVQLLHGVLVLLDARPFTNEHVDELDLAVDLLLQDLTFLPYLVFCFNFVLFGLFR